MRSCNKYAEAVEYLRKCYDRPRLLHEIHVRAIVDAPTLKDGTGKELRCVHDCLVQHLRALTAMGYEPPASFVTSLIQLKLDQNMRFEWQRYTQKGKRVPRYDGMLIFLDSEHRLLRRSHSLILQAYESRSPTSTDLIWSMLATPVQFANLPSIPCTLAVNLGLFPIGTSWLC